MTEIVMQKRMRRAPRDSAHIYRLKSPRVTQRLLLASARSLKLTGSAKSAEITKVADRFIYVEGQYMLTLHRKSGALRYRDMQLWQADDEKTNVEMSDRQAVSAARAFLKSTKLVPIAECKTLKVSRLTVGSMKRGARVARERVVDVGVAFQRTVAGTPVEGPGGKVVVYLNAQGEITGCDKIWREIERIHRRVPVSKLLPPSRAESDVEKYWGRTSFLRIEVAQVRFGYFEGGFDESQRYLQPAYVMPLNLVSADRSMVMKSVHVTPAALESVGKIMPAPKVPPRLPVRRG